MYHANKDYKGIYTNLDFDNSPYVKVNSDIHFKNNKNNVTSAKISLFALT